ncbi:MAG: molybdopterin-dependent oxidoreductase [Chloroflexi bacterium]|nr:molybdopterin-dependent oxidoreductase [Chloroflexota bacterium]MCI0578121.1 molybdopterin-dependent oxidoreductase [Chloroflexota bacterium]MCI0645189.1 molybdopterin-dependent oxidoreductase [Chloroflexota bacterium]MCI0730882.1 molybdopterin-dependent oxidoreductase [Chloroflexota bacterium]
MTITKPVRRVDALAKVTGQALFPGDITPDHLLHGKLLFSGQPHARMVSMDLAAALAVPGVVAILTASDVPVNEYGLIMPDQPVLVGLGSSKPNSDVSLWEGDQVAVVVAESELAAARARDLVRIEWQPLPIVGDVFTALKDELILHPEQGSNVLSHYRIRKGDMAAGWAAAGVVVEGSYRLPFQEHAYLQPEAGLGYIDEAGRVTVAIAGQWTHEDQLQVAHALGLPADQVRIIYPAIGGAFGGREDMSLQIVLGLAAVRLRQMGLDRPVRIIWSREESIIGHHKRHPAFIKTRWGATREGRITAVEAEVILDAGAYAYTSTKVLGNAHLMVAGPYELPNARLDSYAVYTNNVPGGAFRGFGGPQGAFAAESQMNKLAEALGLDPVEIRLKNVLRDGSLMVTQTPIPAGVSLPQVIERCAAEAGWGEAVTATVTASPLRRGRGFACSFKNVGFSFGFPERCEATIELRGGREIQEAVLRHAGADVGQGAHTVFRQMAAEALGLPLELITLDLSDTATSGDSGSASASRMTWMAGNAIRGAAERALAAWENEDRPAVGHFRYVPPPTEPYHPETGASMPNFTYGYVAEVAEVVVDVETGHVHLERVVCANDVGKAINPQLVEGQIEGGVVQAFGYAVMENLQVVDGRIRNPYLSTYLIPGILDVPDQVNSVIMEIPDPLGPWGVRGMAEMPFLPLAPAVTAALHDATGVWFDELPLTPDRVVARLRQHGIN